MKRSDDRILTTHVGSIIRPESLLALVNQKSAATQGSETYQATLHDAVADVVRKQVAAGIDIVNDGEYGKSSWANYVLERIKGFQARPGKPTPLDWIGRDLERFPEVVEKELGMTPTSIVSYVCNSAIEYHKYADVRRD